MAEPSCVDRALPLTRRGALEDASSRPEAESPPKAGASGRAPPPAAAAASAAGDVSKPFTAEAATPMAVCGMTWS